VLSDERAGRQRRAALAALAPAWLLLVGARATSEALLPAALLFALACTAGGLQLAAAGLWRSRPSRAGLALGAAAGLGAIAAVGASGAAPLPSLATLLGLELVALWAWWRPVGVDRRAVRRRAAPAIGELRAAVAGLLALWLLHAWTGGAGDAVSRAALAASLIATLVVGRPGFAALAQGRPLRQWTIAASWLVGLAGALLWRGSASTASAWLLLGPLATAGWSLAAAPMASGQARFDARTLDDLLHDPARLMIASFVLGGAAGALALTLPAAATGAPLAGVDALFTAFSAICVTGLAVRDTAGDFSGFGQAVILALIQIGGLGILTFSTGTMLLARRRLSLRHEDALASTVGADHRGEATAALRRVLGVTLAVEACAAVALSALFWRAGDAPGAAIWRGVFTAVSAFCNAGFALQADSLVGYAGDPLVLHTVALTIMLGGLGPAVVVALPWLGRRRLAPAVALALTTSAVLWVVPAVLFALLEWSHALAPLAPLDRLHNAWFQAVTTRTAGFNSVGLDALQPATWTLIMVLMFIGGSPGSTAGGIKTTTAAVLALMTLAALRARAEPHAFGFRLGQRTLVRAAAVSVAGLASVAALVFALQLTQRLPLDALLFEAVSALATVGLSVGATAALDDVGKVLVTLAMLAGRVGPLSLFWVLVGVTERDAWRRPEAEIPVG
jgi:trk system potassium uptake protein TrkH